MLNRTLYGKINSQMKTATRFIPLCMVFVLLVTNMYAQDLNDEMKKRLRQSLITPEKQPEHQPLQHAPQILPEQDREVLKVSPFTRLPTKGDRIQLLYPPEKYKIHINTNVTNAPPINQRPAGSVRYEFVGKNMQMISTAGTTPSSGIGIDFGPIRKRHRKKDNILKMLEK